MQRGQTYRAAERGREADSTERPQPSEAEQTVGDRATARHGAT